MNIYLRTDYTITTNSIAYLDLQTRFVNYTFEGFNENGDIANQTVDLRFFNPKYGLFYSLSNNSSFMYHTLKEKENQTEMII